jgi:hypothetical protein
MKVRTGYVSNSSSSSFCIFGVNLDEKDAKERMLALATDEQRKKDIEECGAYEMLYDEKGIFFSGGDPNGWKSGIFVGLGWDTIGDDETGGQFKKRVQSRLEEIFGPGLSLGTYEESWYNG